MAPSTYETIARDEIFAALASMGVKLPQSSKLSTENLAKRLMASLDASQQITDLFPIKSGEYVDPRQLQPWAGSDNLMKETHRGSFRQGLDNLMSVGIKRDPAKETFKEMQQILLSFAREWATGRRTFVLMDDIADWAVLIQLFNVHEVNKNTPLYSLSFRTVVAIPNKTLRNQLEDIFPPNVTSASQVRTTPLERKVMLKLLNMNARRLDPEYKPSDVAAKYMKKQWKLSFILPLGPLRMIEIGKFTDISGCEVCGSTKDANRCSSCLSVLYCSKQCQTADWPQHKATCRSLKGGKWTTITFGPASILPTAGQNIMNTNAPLYTSLMNWNESTHSAGKQSINKVSPDDVPPNIHGTKIFLAKFQVSLFQFGNDSHFLIYDRQRSFQIFWKAKEDPEAFEVARRALGDELKMYRFVKRTGDRTMSVCFDRAPAENPPW